MRVDVQRLIGKIYEQGFNKTSFADELDISRETLRSYVRNPGNIPYDVIVRMNAALKLSPDEARDIFFAN